MSKNTIRENIKSLGLKQVIHYMDRDPDANIPRVLSWMESNDSGNTISPQVREARKAFQDPTNNWSVLARSLWTDVDDRQRRRLFESFIVNASMIGAARQLALIKEHGCNIPWAILMDPTSACNLHCTGCWAADYGNKLNLSYEELDDIVTQANRMGTYMFLFSGGEPLVRKGDIIRLCERHPDSAFLAFTNATLIDEAFATEMLRVQNLVPAISVEGFEEETDSRRGKGTYAAVVKAMEILKRRKLLFGVSCCYTSSNFGTIGSDAYFDSLIEKGAKFAWFFTYIPVGVNASPELMVTAEQREYMYHKLRDFRETKPLFTMDFWNDGEFVGGCIAGGKSYLHINANGDIEPCAFIHYSDSNIREKTLLEAFKSPLFMAYHDNQPFNHNHLRPCPLLDNNGALAAMVHGTGAVSTDVEHPEDVDALCAKCRPAAESWQPVSERLWARGHFERSDQNRS